MKEYCVDGTLFDSILQTSSLKKEYFMLIYSNGWKSKDSVRVNKMKKVYTIVKL